MIGILVGGGFRVRHAAVFFDLFDTLCRIDETIYGAGKRAEADLLGIDPEAFVRTWVALADRAQMGTLPDIGARVREAAGLLGVTPSEAIVRRVVQVEIDSLLAGTTLYPDARPALSTIRARGGLRTGLISNASAAAVPLYERLGLTAFFDHAVFSFQVGIVKPSPGIYLAACRALRVDPATCLFVGDGNGGELDGAKAVGMETVRIERALTLHPYRKRESIHFDSTVDDLTRVVSLIRT